MITPIKLTEYVMTKDFFNHYAAGGKFSQYKIQNDAKI